MFSRFNIELFFAVVGCTLNLNCEYYYKISNIQYILFSQCVSKAKKCKERSGGVKKQMKGCAKVFFKCVQDECNKA